jgi:predicted RNA binding protein YcfA (HicA-like mRNA interferase family)
MNFRQITKILRKDGWKPLKRKGSSHIQFVHETKKGKVTVADHGKDEIPPGTLKSIFKQAGL